jgi:hypothetical protein
MLRATNELPQDFYLMIKKGLRPGGNKHLRTQKSKQFGDMADIAEAFNRIDDLEAVNDLSKLEL